MIPPEMNFIKELIAPADTRIVMLVLDGLGGLPVEPGGPTELEAAETPNLDALATEGLCGLHEPVGPGITPGSGPAHLALFGYDPKHFRVGRGVLSAMGVGLEPRDTDVAARGNFCTVDKDGRVTDRRAGRLDTAKNRELCALLREITIPDVEFIIEPVMDYRFLLVLRGEKLAPDVNDTDPQQTGATPLIPEAKTPKAEKTAQLVRAFIKEARAKLENHHPANMVLLRGFSSRPSWPLFQDVFGLRAAALAHYPTYRGVARLLGMQVLDCEESLDEKIGVMQSHWKEFDFFYLHVKGTDSAGEDGNAEKKQALIANVDRHLPEIRKLQPDVLIVTGDHSTPAVMKSHSWHPVPSILWANTCRPDSVTKFGERSHITGGLGLHIPSTDLIPLALAHARRLRKFGA